MLHWYPLRTQTSTESYCECKSVRTSMEARTKIPSTELTISAVSSKYLNRLSNRFSFPRNYIDLSGLLMICSPRKKSYQSNMIPYILLTVATANENGELLVDEVMSALAAIISHSLKCACG